MLTPIYLSSRMVRYSLQNVQEAEAAAAGGGTLRTTTEKQQGSALLVLTPKDGVPTYSITPCRKRTRFQQERIDGASC